MKYCVVVQGIKDGEPKCARLFDTYEEALFYVDFMESLTPSKAFLLSYDSDSGCFLGDDYKKTNI